MSSTASESDSGESDLGDFLDFDDFGDLGDNSKKLVTFDELGRPVGPNSATYTSYLGELSRTHASIASETWKLVPIDQKKIIWTELTKEYDVSGSTKKLILRKANVYWRKFKNFLRKFLDKYETNEERKNHCPTCVKQEDWNGFVDIESTDLAKALRTNGKCARHAVKAEHRSGRKGAARIAHEMLEKDPNVPVTRTRLYIAVHTRKNDDSCPSPERNETVEKIKKIASDNPKSTFLDVDHDPVAQVYGTTSKGPLLGMGWGISKRGLIASAPARHQLKKQKQITSALGDEIVALKSLMKEHSKYIAELRAAQGSTGHDSNNVNELQENVQHNHHASQGTTDWIEKGCKLYSMRGQHVANGRACIGGDVPDPRDFPPEDIETYEVFLDRVIVPNAASTCMETLGEEPIGSMITWPKAMTVIVG